MEKTTVGKVLIQAKIENLSDLYLAENGTLPVDQVRFIEVTEALVDTGATMLSLPKRMVAQLGLKPFRTRQALTSAGATTLRVHGTVRMYVQGRECNVDVLEIPDDCPVLIGQVPLELLDFVVDPVGQRLIGNPAHGGEQMVELY